MAWSCTGNHSCRELVSTMAKSCLEDSTSEPSFPTPSILSVPSSPVFPEPWNTGVPCRAEHSTLTYFQHPDQVWVSALTAAHSRGSFSPQGQGQWQSIGRNISIQKAVWRVSIYLNSSSRCVRSPPPSRAYDPLSFRTGLHWQAWIFSWGLKSSQLPV